MAKLGGMRFLVFLLVVVVVVKQTQTSHFRGAIITWKPGSNQNEIDIEYRISWRMTYSNIYSCNSYTVQQRSQIGGDGTIKCFNNCDTYGSIGTLYYTCTDYSVTEDWSSGRGVMTYSYRTRSADLQFGFKGGAWIDTLNHGASGNWILRVKADLRVRSDIGRVNSSPTAEISPIVRLAYGCKHTINIPVNDADGDIVRCHWASSSKDQCGSVCDGFPNSHLDNVTCTITYQAIYSTGWYAVAIQVEDYSSSTSTTPMSSVPVQFLVRVENNPTGTCTKRVELINPTLPENACVGIPTGQIFESSIVARVSYANRSVSEISTISPVGLTRTGWLNVSATDWRLNWTYSPPAGDTDKTHSFCFTAQDDAGFQSERRCVTLLVGVSPPEFVNGTQTRTKVSPYNRHWRISSSLEFVRTSRSSFIRLYNSKDHLVESIDASDSAVVFVSRATKRLEFTTTTTPLVEKEEYYFNFDFGVIRGVTDCGVESSAIDDPYFWRFRVRDITPPTVTFTMKPVATNESAKLEWTVDEQVTTNCSLHYPDRQIQVMACNNSWSQSNLTEGLYRLEIKATDLEGNSAILTHSWIVDTTPPVVTFLKTPANISRDNPVLFKWICSSPCSTSCSIENEVNALSCDNNQLSWTVNPKQSNKTYTLRLQASDEVGNVATIKYKWTTDFEPPKVTFCEGGQSFNVSCKGDLTLESICNVTANDNMDESPFLNYTDTDEGKCLIKRTWTAVDDAGNVEQQTQIIHIVTEGSIYVNNLQPVSVACGELQNMTNALKSMFVIKHPCGLNVELKYTDNATETCNAVIKRNWTISDNCGKAVFAIQIIKIRKPRLPLAPENGQTGVDLNTYLRWQESSSVRENRVYLWERDSQRPENPIISTSENYYDAKSLKPGTKYRWQVVFNYTHGETYLSPIWVFETRNFADLAVVSITVPITSFTGEICEVKWTVVNSGGLATQQSYWTDAVFMSWTEDFQDAKLVAKEPRRDILYQGDSYSSTAAFKLDEKKFGHAYIFVNTNYGKTVEEHNTINNLKRSASIINVRLTPPPDLQVSSIHPPAGRVFSGSRVTISWTVVNYGTGPTKNGYWYDTVWWSPSKHIGNDAKHLATVKRSENLQTNSNYTQTLSLLIEEFIEGKYFFIVNVDAFNNVYEYLNENNTFASQEPINVVLTAPPDLTVKSVHTHAIWRTGDTVTVNWTVENSGNDSPRSQMYWEDLVVFASNAGFRMIGSTSHYGMLRSNENYRSILSFYVSPEIPSGNYNVTVTTDFRDYLFEYNMNDNNVFTKSIKVIHELPDLQVLNCSFSVEYEANSTKLIAQWQVKNIGNGRTLTNEWTDTLAVKTSDDYFYSVLSQTHISTKNGLIPLESYNRSETIDLPFQLYGPLFFKLIVDDLYESTGDFDRNNNIFVAPHASVTLRAADLKPEFVSVSEYIVGGEDIRVFYVLKNQGNRDIRHGRWGDRIFITKYENSEHAVFRIDQSNIVTDEININSSCKFSKVISLPDKMSGLFYLVIMADVYNDIFEGPNDFNNKVTRPLKVETAPAADLAILSIKANVSEEIGTNKVLYVEWKVKNIGNSMQKVHSWQDNIFFKHALHAESLNLLNRYTVTNIMESQSSYRQRKKLILPSTVSDEFWICAQTDVFGRIYEADRKENNIRCQETAVSIKRPQPARLITINSNFTSEMETQEIVPGSKVIAQYEVQNIGQSRTTMSSWTDSIYMSSNTTVRVKDFIHIGSLEPNQSYSVKTTFRVPVMFKGSLSIFIVPNAKYDNDQSETSAGGVDFHESQTIYPNVTDSNLQQIQIYFILPNLQISNSSMPKNTHGGQPVTLEYDIINTGNVTIDTVWYDSIYLSKHIILDAFDTKLTSVKRCLRIEAGENVPVNMSFTLPLDLATQSYYLTIMTDSRDDIFEEQENDNDFKIVFNMEGRLSADIVVSKVETPTTAEYGSEINVKWQVANNGTKSVTGYKCDSVFLSKDFAWDINDAQVGQPVCSTFTLEANGTQLHYDGLEAETPVVPAAYYNTLIKSRSNTIDLNSKNNVAVSSKKTEVMYTTKGVGSKITKLLKSNGFVAVRYSNISEGKTLIVNITSESKDAFNSVFVKGGSPATLYDFDKSSKNPNLPDQIISIPDTHYSEYYILVENSGSLTSFRIKNITITVKYAQFEVIDVFPKSVLPNEETTLHLSGTLFPYDTSIQLKNKVVTIEAVKTYIYSSTDAYATFLISNTTAMKTFNLTLISGSLNKTIQFKNVITLTNGTTGYLIYLTESPNRLRKGETGIISINLQNAGDSDLYVPLIAVEASDQGSIRLIDDANRHSFEQKYFVFCSMENGPAGILPPRSKCQLKFETKQNETYRSGRTTMTLDTYVLRQNNETSNPYIGLKEYLQPTHYSENEWTRVWNNFITATGNSSLSLSKKLSDILNAMSLGDRYVKSMDDLIKYLLECADAPYNERYLIIQSDFRISSDSEIRLEVNRFMSSRIGSRSQMGYMGKGWILPLWDTKVKKMTGNVLILTVEKIDFHFEKLGNNSFVNDQLGIVEETSSELIHKPYKQRKQFHFDRQTFALIKISSLVDDSYLKMQYDGPLLTKIKHSSGAFVTAMYDKRGRIQTMQLHNSTIAKNNGKLLCAYDIDSGTLSVVRLNRKTTRYAYFQDYSLKYVIYPDRTIIIYEYSDIGHLTGKKYSRDNILILNQEFSYSSSTRVTIKTYPEENTYSLTFDEIGDIILVQRGGFLPDKTVKTLVSETQYDGNMVVRQWMFSNDGDSLMIEDGVGDRLWTYFNNKSQLIGFKDGAENKYVINLNNNGSVRNILFPDGSNKTYIYVHNGHTVMTQNNGVKKYEYNDRKQLTMKNIGNNSIFTYNYDENGMMVNAKNRNTTITMSYELDNIKEIACGDAKLTYNYNSNGLLVSLSKGSDYSVEYDYDGNDRLQNVKDTNGNKRILKVRYNAAGKIAEKVLGNNATTIYNYDRITGLLRNMTNYFPNGTEASYFRYEYSIHLRRIIVHSRAGTWKYKYDRAGQIVSMTDPQGNVTKYMYDSRKNRILVSVNGFDQKTKVNNMNQYMQYRNVTHSYDKNGNMNFRDCAAPEYFTFDEDNKLVAFRSKGHDCILEYDALENLYAKTCDASVARYIINPKGNYGVDIIEQITDKNGKKTKVQYFHGGDQVGLIAAKYDDGSMFYFMYDPLGTVQNILSEEGVLINSYIYDPFGNALASTEMIKTPFTFVGQWGVVDFEEIPDVYFMRSRLYDSFTGRFLSIDAYGLKAHSKNLYAYCSNNPVHFIDPKGDFVVLLAGAAIGSASSALEYAITTPYKDWTSGGFTGAAVSGGITGAFLPSGAGLLLSAGIKTASDLAGGYIQRKIDHQPCTFQDTKSDFIKSALGQALSSSIPKGVQKGLRSFQIYCQLLDLFNKTGTEACDKAMNGFYPVTKSFIGWVVSKDPNDILGPNGVGVAKFISNRAQLVYKIRFENDENATAPAQRVYIEHEYSKHLDSRSFKLDEIGFGNFTQKINKKSVQNTIDLTNEYGIVLRVFAGIDLIKKKAIWEFKSLDPKTGEPPVDPGVGFLPPNNGTSGQGYVSFSIQPREDVAHLSSVHANASIYFDQNDPIDTPNIFNTIDNSPPSVYGSVINETESADSVTLSLSSVDSGSGVKYVDLFQQQGNSFSMFRPGITEDIFIMPLQHGETFSLVAVATDYVGNRVEMGKHLPGNIISINSTGQTDCECSGNGNCSSGTDICMCMDGFYGTYCNSSVPPSEPPVLELQTAPGFVKQPIELTISARNLSGSLNEMEIFVSGFPIDTVFSVGLQNDSKLHLTHEDFGNLNMTTQKHGQFKLNISVVQTSKDWSFTRSGELLVKVYEQIEGVSIDLQGCIAEYDGRNVVFLNSSIVFNNGYGMNNMSSIVPHSTLIKLPKWVHPINEETSEAGEYVIADTLFNSILSVDNEIQQFALSVTVHLEYSSLSMSTFSQDLNIKQFCGRECDSDKYGINCNQTCLCNWQNTEECEHFTGSCICKPEWKGPTCVDSACPCVVNNTAKCDPVTTLCECNDRWTGFRCDTDIDECTNTSVCNGKPNSTCQNSIPGYSCHCNLGFKDEADKCVECTDDRYGDNCDNTCACIWNNTVKCEKENGACVCTGEWNGSKCDNDINECANTSICELDSETICQNNIPGYDCLCRVGYKQENKDDPCVEIKEPGENITAITSHGERITSVTVHIDVQVPSTDNLEVEVTYQKYKKLSVDMLSVYYRNELGDSFIRVIVQKISLGSLVIVHDVTTKDTGEVREDLAVAVVKMTKACPKNPLLTFNGQNVSIEGVSLNKTEVNDVCEVFMSLNPCNSTKCETDQGKPKCRKLPPPSENKDHTILIISLSAGIPIAVLVTLSIVGLCFWRKKKNDPKKVSNDNFELRCKSYVYEHPNPGYDDTESENDDTHALSFGSSSSAWQANPYYDQLGSKKGKYHTEHDAYIYTGRHK